MLQFASQFETEMLATRNNEKKTFKWHIATSCGLEELVDHSYCLLHDTSIELLSYSAFEIQN